ncbi:dihydroorotate dehydrogenase [candidate division WOR-3 bacterium]|nr:dihydroorotate dehydrogenase [candidate division WOR-3 bacterium]
MNLSIKIGNLRLKNPVILASGTSGPEQKEFTNLKKLGAIITKSITPMSTIGNPLPRTVETSTGMLNSIGIENPGAQKFIEEKLPGFLSLNIPVIVSVAGKTQDEYIEVIKRFENTPVSGFEINVSCPNVKKGSIEFGKEPQVLEELTSKMRKATSKPIIIKLSPNVSNIQSLALAAENEGADAISLINTIYGLKINLETKLSELGSITGGLSGPCVKPVALYYVYKVSQVCKIPIIGIGGIMTTQDALEFIVTGASAIELGTVNFVNPNAGVEILSGIKNYCERQGIKSLKKLIGSRNF